MRQRIRGISEGPLVLALMVFIQSATGDVDTPAEFTVTETVSRPAGKVPPLGVNNLGSSGANTYAANNFVYNSGNEPISIRRHYRVTNAAENWFEVDGGGVSNWDLWRSGFFSGARARVYRLVDADGNALPIQGNYLDLENADHVVLIREDHIIPAGAEGFPDGGWIANRYTTPHNLGPMRHNLTYTDPYSVTNGKTYVYTVVAVDANGNESGYGNEVAVTPSASADNGPRIVVSSSDGLPDAAAGQPYGEWGEGYTPSAIGGTAPLEWHLLDWSGQPLELPAGLTFNPATGAITGTPEGNIDNLQVRFQVTDSEDRTDTRNFVINAPADTPTPGDSTAPEPPTNIAAAGNDASVTLSWTASTSPDVVSYRILRSTAPAAEQMERAFLEGDGPELRPHDYVFIEHRMNEIDLDTVSPRVRSLANNGEVQWYWRSRWDPEGVDFSLEEHDDVPPAMVGAGDTCLRIDAAEGGQTIWQIVFIGLGIEGEDLWYGQLEPGEDYRLEVWLRQEALANGGQVDFGYSNGYPGISTTFDVTGEWQKFTYDFAGPARPSDIWHFGQQFSFTGPGTLWMENCRIFRYDSPADLEKPYVPNRTVLNELLDAQPATGPKGSLRMYGPFFGSMTMDSILSWHADSSATVDWYSAVSPSTAMTAPVGLEFALQTGDSPETRMRPWLTFQIYTNEQEWRNLIEYLAAPYDPEVDTPESKPYAYRRTQHRGTNTPWTDEFDEIILELGNETWHNGAGGYEFLGFGPSGAVWQGGVEYGLFADYFLGNAVRNTPYWNSENLDGKISFTLGAGYEAQWDGDSDGTGWYGESAIQRAPVASLLGHATYVGPKWETGDSSPETFDDLGVLETLVGHLTGTQTSYERFGATRDLLESEGTTYDIVAYEGGPSGFAVPGTSTPERDETAERYGKSLAMAVSALDSWMDAYHNGWTHQAYYSYGQGTHWSSHTLLGYGFRPSPGWLAMKLRNRNASGDLMEVDADSVPTYMRRGVEELPLAGCHAFRGEDAWSVILLSRKIDGTVDGTEFGDGTTPVTLNLPFQRASRITLHKLTGDPRDNNRESMTIEIQSEDIDTSALDGGAFVVDETTGGVDGGMPPGSIYVYVFELSQAAEASNSWSLR